MQLSFLRSKRTIFIVGLLLISAGLILNEMVLTALFSSDGVLDRRSIVIIWLFDLSLIIIGLVLAIGRAYTRLLDLAVGLAITGLMIFGAEKLFHRLNNPPAAVDASTEGVTASPPPQVIHEGDYVRDFFQPDPLLGYQPRPDAQVSSIKRLGETVVYDVVYSIDAHQRRLTPVEQGDQRDKFLLFFGGSFVFGEGINDDETLPTQVGQLAPNYQPYNYGLSGYGPQQMLAKLQSDELATEISQEAGIAIYTFIDGHVERAIGSMFVYNAWGDEMPYYTINWQGDLVRKGDFRTGRPLRSTLYELLSKSEIATYFQINIPSQLRDHHYAFAVRLMAEARDSFQAKFNSNDFYVLIYPDEGDYFEDMEAHLRAANLNVLNYDERLKLDEQEELAIAGDGHPTKKAHRSVAEYIVADLGIGTR